MKKFKAQLKLFITFFKIGLFTFGGGYAMVAVMERELVERKKWIEHEEFLDVIAIAESTPGPIAINSATYIGYKRAGVLGSIFATLGVIVPSFVIIFAISLVFDRFMEFKAVQYAFRGIQAGVAFIILSAGFKMLKKIKRTPLNVLLFGATTIAMITLSLFALKFSSIFYILIGGTIGLIVYLISLATKKNKEQPKKEEKGGNE